MMEQPKNELLLKGYNPDDYIIKEIGGSYVAWHRDFAPEHIIAEDKINKIEELINVIFGGV